MVDCLFAEFLELLDILIFNLLFLLVHKILRVIRLAGLGLHGLDGRGLRVVDLCRLIYMLLILSKRRVDLNLLDIVFSPVVGIGRADLDDFVHQLVVIANLGLERLLVHVYLLIQSV